MATEEQIKEMIKENLVKYRKANKLTGEEVAEALSMNHGTYRSWETGRSCPKFSGVIRLAQIYGVSIDSFLCDHRELLGNRIARVKSSDNEYTSDVYGDDYLSQLSSQEKIMVMKIRQLNQKDRQKVIDLLKELTHE